MKYAEDVFVYGVVGVFLRFKDFFDVLIRWAAMRVKEKPNHVCLLFTAPCYSFHLRLIYAQCMHIAYVYACALCGAFTRAWVHATKYQLFIDSEMTKNGQSFVII